MAYITITNQSNFDVKFLNNYASKLKPYLDLVDKSKYPFRVIVQNKKNHYDRSSFDLTSSELILKIDMKKQSEEEIAWVLVHEFFHFLSNGNKELQSTCLSEEYETLIKILMKKFNLSEEQVGEIFHDFLPAEVAANSFATMIIGKFYKRHDFKLVRKAIHDNQKR